MVTKLLNRKKLNPNLPTYTGTSHHAELYAQLFVYNKTQYEEYPNYKISDFKEFQQNEKFSWLNIHGIHDVEKIKTLCSKLKIHDLAIQDLLDVNQRPKFQEFDDYWFFTLKSIMPTIDSSIEQVQLSFILGKNYLVSFQERKDDYFNHIREQLRKNIGLVRERGSDYLLYLLLESILDNYFKTLTDIESTISESVVIDIKNNPSQEIINLIERIKAQIHQIKKTVIPVKEFVIKIEREKFSFVDKRHVKYYYELKDLCLSLLDDCEQIEVGLESSTNLFFSVQGQRMNQVMKTLTIVATIFIPLTFIVGVYGMNFSNMPELGWKWGYITIWGIMLGIFLGMVVYFKRKKWF